MVYVFLANGFEETEALIPVDYLRRCEDIEVKTVGVGGKVIEGSHGIPVVADITTFDIDMDNIDMVVLPGGMPGTLNLEKSYAVKDILNHCYKKNIPIGAICAAPSILGHLGMLKGKKATCYNGFEDELIGAEVTKNAVETDGNIITSRGAGTANQFAFVLIEKLYSNKKAQNIKAAVIWQG